MTENTMNEGKLDEVSALAVGALLEQLEHYPLQEVLRRHGRA